MKRNKYNQDEIRKKIGQTAIARYSNRDTGKQQKLNFRQNSIFIGAKLQNKHRL